MWGGKMNKLVRKTLLSLILTFYCFVVFFPYPSVTLSFEIKDDITIRVLIDSKETAYDFSASSSEWKCHSAINPQNYVTLSSSHLMLALCTPSTKPRYLARTNLSFPWHEALSKAHLIADSVHKTNLHVFMVEDEKNQFYVETGPFDHSVDAAFFCSMLLSASGTSFNILSIAENKLFATLQWLQRPIYLRSALFHSQESPRLWYMEDAKNALWKYKSRSYPFHMLTAFHPQQQLMVINELPLEEYLRSVVPAEMPYRWPFEALKAQAVASRSFAWSRAIQSRKSSQHFDLTNDTYSQVYLGERYFSETDLAIAATKGQVLSYNGQLIEGVFHSTSGGHTENNEFVWSGSPRDYLRGVSSEGEEVSPHFTWYKCYKADEFLNAIHQHLSSKGRNEKISSINSTYILEKGSSPRVRKIQLNSEKDQIVLSGQEFQSIFSLKSTWFDILVWESQLTDPYWKDYMNPPSKKEKWIYIYGRGWGHGVGMSQYGASAQAKRGASYQEILSLYYQGSNLSSINHFKDKTASFALNKNDYKTQQVCDLTFDPSQMNIEIGEQWNVQLKISSPSSIQGISMDILYDPFYVQILEEGIVEGTFLRTGGKTTIFLKKIEGNKIHVGIGREGKAGGVTGEGILLEINGKALRVGKSKIELQNIHVLDSQLQDIETQSDPLDISISEPDITPPKTLIIDYPMRYINQPFVFFQWTGSDNKTQVEDLFYSYRLNEDEWSVFSKETSYTFHLVHDGAYMFSVRAKDEAGNIDLQPPIYTFFLDMTPPLIHLDNYPSLTKANQIKLSGKTEPDATLLINAVRCFVNESGYFTYDLPLSVGENFVRLIAIDPASNATSMDILIIRELFQPIIITLTIGSQKALVNDVVKILDAPPFIEQGRTLVPLRFIAESFTASVDWLEQEKRITIQLNLSFFKRTIILWIGSNQANVDGKMVSIDVLPVVKPPGRTFVPLRFIAEEFGSKVEWYPQTQGIRIVFPDPELKELSLVPKESW